MRLPERLRALDKQFVPLGAARVRDWADRLAVQRGRWVAKRQQLGSITAAELDARYASRGPLAMVRELPQIGFVIIAVVFAAATATAVVRYQPSEHPSTSVTTPLGSPETGTRLGADIGQATVAYQAISRKDLEAVVAGDPSGPRLALVSLARYETPQQVASLLGGVTVRRVYLRAPTAGRQAMALPFDIHGSLPAGLRKAYETVALSRLEARRELLAYVATTKNDKAFHDDYATFAASAGREVTAYQHSCACVFSAIVEAPAKTLQALENRPGVRALQVAGKSATLIQLLVQPLLPETSGLVGKTPLVGAP